MGSLHTIPNEVSTVKVRLTDEQIFIIGALRLRWPYAYKVFALQDGHLLVREGVETNYIWTCVESSGHWLRVGQSENANTWNDADITLETLPVPHNCVWR
jgi:hypothetical protein